MAKRETTPRAKILIILISILVAISVIAVVLPVLMSNYEGQAPRKTAEEAIDESRIGYQEAIVGQVRSYLEIYYLNHGTYPDAIDDFLGELDASNSIKIPTFSYKGSENCYILMYTNDYSGEFKTYTCDS